MPFKKPSLIFLNHLFEEYLEKRIESSVNENLLTSALKGIYSTVTQQPNTITNIKAQCKSFAKDFAAAFHKPAESEAVSLWINNMINLGEIAFKAQNVSATESKFCMTAHAMRTYIYGLVHSSEVGQQALLKTQESLKNDYEKFEKSKNDIPQNEPDRIKKVELVDENCCKCLRHLAYLGFIHPALHDIKKMGKIFPKLKFPTPVTSTSFVPTSNDELNQNKPLVLHDNYIQLYINEHFSSPTQASVNLDALIKTIETDKLYLMGYADLGHDFDLRNSPTSLARTVPTLKLTPTLSSQSPSLSGQSIFKSSSNLTSSSSSSSILTTANSTPTSSPDSSPNTPTPG